MSDALEKAAREVLRQLDYARKDGRDVPVGTDATDALRAALEAIDDRRQWKRSNHSPRAFTKVLPDGREIDVWPSGIPGYGWEWAMFSGSSNNADWLAEGDGCASEGEAKAAAERAAGVRS